MDLWEAIKRNVFRRTTIVWIVIVGLVLFSFFWESYTTGKFFGIPFFS